ncbi:protein of unknown function (plasmid) [Azospirillum baldaniorum]|uniref:Uncharacterized protein n=1 Tax=Azospirillum baldaniorum TaxID=1064539 RepID=A0A9P1K1F1_9PROT|nr:protein of unknown function [Azospirillum baldaniorum]
MCTRAQVAKPVPFVFPEVVSSATSSSPPSACRGCSEPPAENPGLKPWSKSYRFGLW